MGLWTASSAHGGGANVLFLDGHVGFAKDGIDPDVWHALATRAGNEVVSAIP
jgi:prepilin-type processing-associated H-X9-DG protein